MTNNMNPHPPTQPEISIEALHQGDRSEFARLVDTYSGPIYRLALKILNNPQDAEDVLQETFFKALRGIQSFEGRSSLATWLYRIAVNEALMSLRRRQAGQVSLDQVAEADQEPQEPLEVADWCCLPEEELLTVEARQFLDAAVEELSPPLRVVFLLRDIEGLSIRDSAETLNLTETAVKTRLLRARLFLRGKLSEYYQERLAEVKKP
ncbi:MAG TPA: sigma-70 family RNA polymerase sigma factor [Anaerolineaceae bacterium]|nr:sigma-70 family RNA polymerase sigma factor [Anaerolineaceae bacterium]